jgi:hypothetical protein
MRIANARETLAICSVYADSKVAQTTIRCLSTITAAQT